jgi:hypothetical protein
VTQDDDLKLSLTTAADERANKPAQDPIQQTRQDKPSLNRSGRDHQQQPFRRIEFLYPTGLPAVLVRVSPAQVGTRRPPDTDR